MIRWPASLNSAELAWLDNLITPWSRVLLEKLTGSHLVKKFPAFHGTRRFNTAFTSARHLSLSWARSIQSIPPHPTSRRSILILSSHLRLGLSRFPHQNPVYASPLLHTRYMHRPSHSYRFYHPNNIRWAVQIIKLLIMCPLLIMRVQFNPLYTEYRNPQLETVTLPIRVVPQTQHCRCYSDKQLHTWRLVLYITGTRHGLISPTAPIS